MKMNEQNSFCEAILGLQFIGQNFVFVRPLDKGEFGQIWIGRDIKNNELVAIKQMSLKKRSQYSLQLIRRELNIMKQLEPNENVIRFIDQVRQDDNLYIIMELCQQNLHQKISNIRKKKGTSVALTESEAVGYMKQILNGFRSLRKQNIIHRDIKLKNILVKNNVLKIADFGLAINKEYASSQVGTPYTKAPEVYDGVSRYSDKADIWSLGIIFYQMLFDLNYPFPAKDERELQNKIKQGNISYNIQNIRISQQTQALLNHMLQVNPDYRISWEELFNHPVFQQQERLGFMMNIPDGGRKRNASLNCFDNTQAFSSPQSECNQLGIAGFKSNQNLDVVPVNLREEENQDNLRQSTQKFYKQMSNGSNGNYSIGQSFNQQQLLSIGSRVEDEKVFLKFNVNNNSSNLCSSKSNIDQQSTISSVDQRFQKQRITLSIVQETLINCFLLVNVDKSIYENQELLKFCSGTQFELSLFLKYIDENLMVEEELVNLHQDLYKEARLNIVQYLSEPRKLQEIDSFDRTKYLKCLRKYFFCLLTQAKFVNENTTNSSNPVKILEHAYDILKCALASNQFTLQNQQMVPTIPPKDKDKFEKIPSSKYATFYQNLTEFSRRVF
ncbi:Serine/Threonine kinase domain protein (macronuclear) [Tetrahymena thermophila SB210]|uniref:Serine/Threonine kinase domain protein n=1 Tax=Tetrahymena thermophila (strain SB210) TaxID=312017 RepID=I7MGG5_TETTS|nr:Serine/Threonine kinase domain protein [Tetrahymena thermophila SB210]EAR85140.2 Serine/Threonine kinase domain protein [Tetrahymena thermophila SB210]|eukprot:XP_001032803.2 Serine/Threonine kinase domain protein [Tetrahymena thermophila SB210]